MYEPQIHSDVKDPNYSSREQEIEAKERAVKLDLVLRFCGLAVLVALFAIGALLG